MGRDPGKTHLISGALTSDEVAAYLADHPDFLVRRPELLQHLTPPALHRGGSVVDFQVFMVERLRATIHNLEDQQQELLLTTRTNLNHQSRVHNAALVLLDAQSLEHLIQTITTDLAVMLDLDVSCLVIEANGRDHPRVLSSGVRVVEPGTIRRFMGRRDTVLNGDTLGDPVIFGGAAGLVRSEALIRLQVSSETPDGLLAFGSRDEEMFHPGQGTELIMFLARVAERCIRSWLDLPPPLPRRG